VPKSDATDWRGSYSRKDQTLAIRSAQGFDIQVICCGRDIKPECKGGPLGRIKGKNATSILAQAIGQVITCAESESRELWIAVPDSQSFENAAKRIGRIEAFKRTGIKIGLVSETGDVRVLS
jgi:hypothetical protein